MQQALGTGVVGSEPKKVHTIAIHPDQAGGGAAMAAPAAAQSAPPARQMPSRVVANNPTVATEPARAPRQTLLANAAPPAQHAQAQASANAPLSLNPNDEAAPPPARVMRTASAPAQIVPQAAARTTHVATGSSGAYAVQISSQRSEAEAQAAFHGLQAKFPSQLGGRQPIIHRVDLGDKGIYFRAMVGPFANSNEAGELCSSMKAAGGNCIVQRN
jgi:hypothetical protein